MGFFDNYSGEGVLDYMDESFNVLMETNVVKMDKQTMKKKMLRRATLAAAKQANDPLYHKYIKHTKLRKAYRRQIQEKYQGRANAIVKQWMAANKASN